MLNTRHYPGSLCSHRQQSTQSVGRIALSTQRSFLSPTSCRLRTNPSYVPSSTASAAIYDPEHPKHTGETLKQQDSITNISPLLPAAVRSFATACAFIGAVTDRVRDAVAGVFPQVKDIKAMDVHLSLRAVAKNVRILAVVAPLARVSSSESLTALYARTFERAAFGFAKMYLFCLFMRVLLSWFPEIDWNAHPWTFLRLITEPYLQIYRGILPPLFGQLDFTPLVGFLILQDVVEVMAPTYTLGMHAHDTSTKWTTSDVMCYFDGF